MKRSKAAFHFSAHKLWAETGNLYFWTFTFREVPLSDEWALAQWNSLMKKFWHHFGAIHGLRVIELHKTHGIHFHLLVNVRIPVERVIRCAWPLEFGRIGIERVEEGQEAIDYLAKYLGKGYEKTRWPSRRRQWGAVLGFKPTRCKDVEYETPFHENKRLFFGDRKADWKELSLLAGLSNFGLFEDWPQVVQERWMAEHRAKHPHDNRRSAGYLKYIGDFV